MIYKVALWIDDMRQPPKNYAKDYNLDIVIWCHSVNEAKDSWLLYQMFGDVGNSNHTQIIRVDLDHDAGDFANDGGDFINFLNWLELMQEDMTKVHWHIHSFNPVGRQNMRRIIEKNGAYVI